MAQERPAVAAASSSASVTIPEMKLPWNKSWTNIPLIGGPHSDSSQVACAPEPISSMSGVDFGLPVGTNVLAVAAGKILWAGPVSDSRGPYIVAIDHGGNFATEYWHLSSIDPAIKVGEAISQGRLLGISGTLMNGTPDLQLEFRTGTPEFLAPISAQGMLIDGYRIWTYVNTSTGKGYNYQGTMTRGATISKRISACNVEGVMAWYSKSGPTIVADANGSGGYLTSTNVISYFDDFSTYTPGQPPIGYLLRGESGTHPTIEDINGIGPVLDFPAVYNEYWDRWVLKEGVNLSHSYAVTVKLNFQTSGDRGGLTIAWNDANMDRIDIQPNIYWQNIEFRITYTGPIPASPVVTGPGLNRFSLPWLKVGSNYWLRVVARSGGPAKGNVTVYMSSDGINFTPEVAATGLG